MTNAFGPLVGSGGGVTSVKDIRYETICNDEDVIKKIASIGYKYIELFDGNLTKYENNLDEFTQILKKYDVSLLGVYVGANFIYEDALEDELFRIDKVAELAKRAGAKHLVLGGGAIRSTGPKQNDYVLLAKGLDKANELIKKHGLIASYHPHLGSLAQRPEEIDHIFSLTDINFCPDIAHLVAGGSDALSMVKDYFKRIKYIHLKDIKNNVFVPLGQGEINLKDIISFLKDSHYEGDWLAEIDGYPGDPVEACKTSYQFFMESIN